MEREFLRKCCEERSFACVAVATSSASPMSLGCICLLGCCKERASKGTAVDESSRPSLSLDSRYHCCCCKVSIYHDRFSVLCYADLQCCRSRRSPGYAKVAAQSNPPEVLGL
jgi:hypothetical protein